MQIQTIIVFIIIGLSAYYLACNLIQSTRAKKQGHCSGCGKE